MPTRIRAAGRSDVGRQRDVNEDRVHVDVARGIYIVVDGVGGQAAGGKAADTAVDVLRARLIQPGLPTAARVRTAITDANNEIYRLAAERPEWQGMACVLTVALLDHGRVTIGHVGDTRAYAVRADGIEKLTPDHSPVGEREDAREISEMDAMRHPRRNEVYRDVGSDHHEVADTDFIWLSEIDLAPGTSLLLCSDGLSDLVPSEAIRQIVLASPGQPDVVVGALIAAANDAGGKDNVSVVFVDDAGSLGQPKAQGPGAQGRRLLRGSLILLILVAAASVWIWRAGLADPHRLAALLVPPGPINVGAGQSIMTALAAARPGDQVVVDPGEYRERVVVPPGVRLTSRDPRAATLRLPANAAEGEAAVVVDGARGGEVSGFRIVGDAATPLGTAVLVQGGLTHGGSVRLIDLDISGATTAAIDLGASTGASLLGLDLHDNAGAALIIGEGGSPRIAHSRFARNGTAATPASAFRLDAGAVPLWFSNVFVDVPTGAIAGADPLVQRAMEAANTFVISRPLPAPTSSTGRASRGR